jgi:hypothetical protein
VEPDADADACVVTWDAEPTLDDLFAVENHLAREGYPMPYAHRVLHVTSIMGLEEVARNPRRFTRAVSAARANEQGRNSQELGRTLRTLQRRPNPRLVVYRRPTSAPPLTTEPLAIGNWRATPRRSRFGLKV